MIVYVYTSVLLCIIFDDTKIGKQNLFVIFNPMAMSGAIFIENARFFSGLLIQVIGSTLIVGSDPFPKDQLKYKRIRYLDCYWFSYYVNYVL